MKKFRVSEFFDAIEQNGLEQATGGFFEYEDGDITFSPSATKPIIGACAVGMAAINLGVEVESLRDALPQITDEYDDKIRIAATIETWNDDELLTFREIATKGRKKFAHALDIEIEVSEYEYFVQENPS